MKHKLTYTIFFTSWLLFGCLNSYAKVVLPKIFSSNMVVQRDKPLKLWGWADKGEAVSISFNGQTTKTKADKNGNWHTEFQPMKYGGPFMMTITGKDGEQQLTDILIGDVWLCSGQSNMEWMLMNTNNAQEEIAGANYENMRLFTVEKSMKYFAQDTLAGGTWKTCTSENIPQFSAVAYFFGRKLTRDLSIPIGLVHSSWGGTDIQTWISWDEISKDEEYKDIDRDELSKIAEENQHNYQQYISALEKDPGIEQQWFANNTDHSSWKEVQVPGEWGTTDIGNQDGIIWFSTSFDVPDSLVDETATVNLGPIDDEDVTYVNGQKVGSEKLWNAQRSYPLESGILKSGKNQLVVKVVDYSGGGGMYGQPEELYVVVGGMRIPLDQTWTYKPAVVASDYGVKDVGPNSSPSLLYNAMIAPIIQFPLKGIIWYQGENNAFEAYKYRTMFPQLIEDWRAKWNDELPFIWVQLANFMQPAKEPKESEWAELREAQSMTLSLPKTGQAVIIDIGEANDIHPKNKQDVGYRLALAALKVAYDKNVVYSGPTFKSMEVEGDQAILSFDHIGSGLDTHDKYGYVRGFAVAGEDKKFYWAKAYIESDKVVVYSDQVSSPVEVRYAWGDNPDDASLYNQEGLPASPFRTDDWKGITVGK